MRTILLSFALLHPAFAQSEKIEIRTLSLGGGEFPKLWVADGEHAVPLVFSSVQPSLPLRVNRLQPFPVFSGDLDEKGIPEDSSPQKVTLPAGDSHLLLGWMIAEKPNFLAIADPFRSARHDEWIVINTSMENIAIRIGGQKKPLQIKPGAHAMVKIASTPDTGAPSTIAFLKDGQWKPFYSAFLPVFPDKRSLIIISKAGTRLHANIISDELPRPEAKER